MIKQMLFTSLMTLMLTIHADNTTQKSEKIPFTQEESELLYDIVGLFGNRVAWNSTTHYVLAGLCGWGFLARPDSYDPQESPDCAKVLAFLKYYKKEQLRLDAEAHNLLYKDIFAGRTCN